jgi:ATP synthase protein I
MRTDPKLFAVAGKFTALGLEMGLSVVLGLLGGRWLDAQFGTKPWLSITGVLLGISAAFLALFRVSRALLKASQQTNAPPKDPSDDHTP